MHRLLTFRVRECRTHHASGRSEKWAPLLRRAMFTFSDLQLVSSISLLVSGYSQFGCGLETFHWRIAVDLAWFSSTHLTKLTCLRHHFQGRTRLRLWRVMCMTVVAALLGCALVSYGSSGNAGIPPSLPAQCLYHPGFIKADHVGYTYPQYESLNVVLSLAFLGFSYLTRLIQLFPTASRMLRRNLRTRPSTSVKCLLIKVK